MNVCSAVSPRDLRVDATDLSTRVLDIARRGE
jgi:chemotaxis methyl-accepting protein methylase